MSNYYVIGSGIVGSIIAHELAKAGNMVEVYERRNHLGGNIYDCKDRHGIYIQMYGPHIFHTNDKRIYEYALQYCQMKDFNLVCGSVIDGICVTTSFDFTAVDKFFPEESEIIKSHIKSVFPGRESAAVTELLASEDPYVKKFARFLYEKDYKPYTAKQWGISPEEIDPRVLSRVPILFSYGSRYFGDKYQCMPVNGYQEMIRNLLDYDRIKIHFNTNGLDIFKIKDRQVYRNGKLMNGTLVYTGAVDELFGFQFGGLPYRSLRFEWKYEDIESFQELPVVAYPQAEGYTRITEYKKLPVQEIRGTTYAVEYPVRYHPGGQQEPYYPVLTENSRQLYKKYSSLAASVKGLVCAGRLADFKYYNMDQAMERALAVSADLIKNGGR